MNPKIIVVIVVILVVLAGVWLLDSSSNSTPTDGSFAVTTSDDGVANLTGNGQVGVAVETTGPYSLQVYLNDSLVGVYTPTTNRSGGVIVNDRLQANNELRVEYVVLPAQTEGAPSGSFEVQLVAQGSDGELNEIVKRLTGPASVPEPGTSDIISAAFTYEAVAVDEEVIDEIDVADETTARVLEVYQSFRELYENQDLEGVTAALELRNHRLAASYNMSYEDTVEFENSFISRAFSSPEFALRPAPEDLRVRERGGQLVLSSENAPVLSTIQIPQGGGFVQVSYETITFETIDGELTIVAMR